MRRCAGLVVLVAMFAGVPATAAPTAIHRPVEGRDLVAPAKSKTVKTPLPETPAPPAVTPPSVSIEKPAAPAAPLAPVPPVADEPPEAIESDVSTHTVTVTSAFSGTEIVVFGSVDNSRQESAESGYYDIVVLVEGRGAPAVVRLKDNVGGLWINTQAVRFNNLPL